ncbi:hypothetical protein [Nannocystis pusilla]|uniref:hypothetical protein n=1 Tax=Nannocystis pusilla TaxID=889268 RepID=UPI003DA2C362
MGNTVLTATFINYSSTLWYRDAMGWQAQAGVAGISQQPPTSLQAYSGSGVLQYEQELGGTIADGDAGIWCCWNNGSQRFGVKLWAGMQVLGMGDRPDWYHMNDSSPNSNSNINWVKLSDPSDNYTWPSSLGFKITAVPTSSHTTLAVTVTIQNT